MTGNRALVWTSVLGMIGWALLVLFMFGDWNTRSAYSPREGRIHEREEATQEGPPVIKLSDLTELGFGPSVIRDIEPHFHVLNAALVTLVELHVQYDAEPAPERKDAIERRAGVFHITADMHEERIEAALSAPLRAQFHAYMRRKETAAGLHNDERWHIHEEGRHVSPFP